MKILPTIAEKNSLFIQIELLNSPFRPLGCSIIRPLSVLFSKNYIKAVVATSLSSTPIFDISLFEDYNSQRLGSSLT